MPKLALTAIAVLSCGIIGTLHAAVTVANLASDEMVSYQLLLINGSSDAGGTEVSITHAGRTTPCPIVDGRFKALVLLKRGGNTIELTDGVGDATRLDIKFQPITTGPLVQLVYITASDGDGTFQAPPGESNDLESAKRRIRLAGLLMQTATAELMAEAGQGRKTFSLKTQRAGEPDVRIYRDDLTMEEAHKMEGNDLWQRYFGKFRDLPNSHTTKYAAFMQMTRYVDGKALAHTALGGGNLGLFGTGGMHTWPEDISQVASCFSDDRDVREFGLFPDASNLFWSNCSTTLGASLHEIGHTFGLPHSGDSQCIMERGFDRFNRVFMLTESGRPIARPDVRWSKDSAELLDKSPWFSAAKTTVRRPPR